MHQRFLLEHAFIQVASDTEAALVDSSVPETPERTWATIVEWLRRADTKRANALVMAIWASGDPLLRLNLIGHLDPAYPAELQWLTRLVKESRADEQARELYAIALKHHPTLCKAVLRKRDLPPALQTAVAHACVLNQGASRAAGE